MKHIVHPETLEYSTLVPKVWIPLPVHFTKVEIKVMEVIVILTVHYVQVICKSWQLFKAGVIMKKTKFRELE